MMVATEFTPLCPAGHLPHKGGEYMRLASNAQASDALARAIPLERAASQGSISPLVGEMAGRPEGGDLAPLNEISQEA